MADKEKENKATEAEDKAPEKGEFSKPAKGKVGILSWVIMITIIAALSGSGFVLGNLLAGSLQTAPDPAESQEEIPSEAAAPQTPDAPKAPAGTWYYHDLESVVVNPDEPGATRFVRVGLILEISNELSQEEAQEMFEGKSPLLINWLNLYFKSLSLDQMENEKDMNRILSQICSGFNEILFPEAKPQIKNVLIREFNIQ